MSNLIPLPILDDRSEERFVAEMIGQVSGGLDAVRIDRQIAALRELREIVAAGSRIPACPELTNANPSSPHTVLLEQFGIALYHQAYLLNQLPVRDQIAFANLFVEGPRAALKATTTLRFTSDGQHNATVPAGTQVSTAENVYTFSTQEELLIPADPNALTGDVAAEALIAGPVLLSDSTLTKLSDPIAFIAGVANPDPVDSGAVAETVDRALQRALSFQRRGRRLVTAQDVEDFVLDEVMQGIGIVRVFPFIREGDFTGRHAGYTSIVAMTPNGHGVSDEIEAAIYTGLGQMIGSQFPYVLTPHDLPNVVDPLFVAFSVAATIRLASISNEVAVKAAGERNLRDFYAVKMGNFGRTILRSEIIAILEGTSGVDRIASDPNGPIVETPGADLDVAVYQLPKLVDVNLTIAP